MTTLCRVIYSKYSQHNINAFHVQLHSRSLRHAERDKYTIAHADTERRKKMQFDLTQFASDIDTMFALVSQPPLHFCLDSTTLTRTQMTFNSSQHDHHR